MPYQGSKLAVQQTVQNTENGWKAAGAPQARRMATHSVWANPDDSKKGNALTQGHRSHCGTRTALPAVSFGSGSDGMTR